MKKALLFLLSVMAFTGIGVAQDVYSVGNFTNSSGLKCVAVYLNYQKMYEKVPPLGDYDFDSPCLAVDGSDAMFKTAPVNRAKSAKEPWRNSKRNNMRLR